MEERRQAEINSVIYDVCRELLPSDILCEVATDTLQHTLAHVEISALKFVTIDREEWARLRDRDHVKNLVRARLLYSLDVLRESLMEAVHG